MKKLFLFTAFVALCALLAIGIAGCRKEIRVTATTEDVNIVDYLKKSPEKFSELVNILERSGTSGFLNAYGTYTLFAPTNEAVKAYLAERGKTSVSQLPADSLKSLVRLHLIEDTITTKSFNDGKMPRITMYGQYLVTNAVNESGVTRTLINRQATIVESNVLVANGIIQVLDRVLQPARKTLAEMVAENSRYVIFTRALKETGFYDTLNVANSTNPDRRWLTLVAQPDSVYRAIGINNYDDLKARYSNTGNPKNPADSLYLYVAYHILSDIKYLADIVSYPSHPTLAPLEVLTAKLKGERVLLNDDEFNGVLEPGVPLDRNNSDHSAVNGVLHSALDNIYIKVRKPTAVYFDVADQPELRKMTSIFRKGGKFVDITPGQLAGVTWQQGTIRYSVEAATSTNFYYWDDKLEFGLRTNPVVNNWIEFTTPMLVKGKYKVWICFRRGVHGTYTQASFDGQPLSRIISLTDFTPAGPDTELEAQGWKRYSSAPATNTTQAGRLAGIVDVLTTDRHKIRLQALRDAGSGGSGVTLDMIHFIPVNDNQLSPKFYRDGSIRP